MESQWLPEQKVAIQTFFITETATGQTRVYRNTTQAWPESDLVELLAKTGFDQTTQCNTWPCNIGELKLWVGQRADEAVDYVGT